MKKRILQRTLIILVLVMLTGCASLQVQARVSSCQQILASAFSPNNRIPRQERKVLLALDDMAQGRLSPVAVGAFPCKHVPPPCLWPEVTCSSGHVTKIDINNNKHLAGQIPPELGNLSQLQTLYLYANQLSGGIPLELGNLSQLEYLSLAANQLSGEIPPELGNLSHLKVLYLSDNQLVGEIPVELGNLSRLEGLGLAYNQLSGEIPPELGQLTQLKVLDLSNNQLSGEIPTELGNLGMLRSLILRRNSLSGPFPNTMINALKQSDNSIMIYIYNTDLCIPRTADFESWISDFEEISYCE